MLKTFKTAVIGLCTFVIVFTLLPTGSSGNDVMQAQKNMTVTSQYSTYASSLTAPFVTAELSSVNSETVAMLTKNIMAHGGFADYIYDYAETTDPYGASVKTCNPREPNSPFGVWREGYGGYHGGEDMQPELGGGYCIWQCAFFSGTVRECYYSKSWGRTVLVESDAVPGLYFRYAHMGPGNATEHDGKMPQWQRTLKYPNGESITYMGQQPTQYELDNGYKGYGNSSSTWAGGGVLVRVGDHVEAGQRLGIFGTTGSSTGLHTHMELYLAIDATGALKGYVDNGNRVMYPNYRTGAYAVISTKSFENAKWLYYVSNKDCGSREMSAEDAMKLLEQNFGSDGESSFGGPGESFLLEPPEQPPEEENTPTPMPGEHPGGGGSHPLPLNPEGPLMPLPY